MRKALLHFAILAFSFFAVWFSLSRIDFVTVLKIEQITKENEQRISDFILELMRRGNDELDDNMARAFVERIKERICNANGIANAEITLHIVIKEDVNAFALPGRHLVVSTGMIRYCRNPEELSGVLAHEIAHIEHNHVMKKLVREVGLSMLTTMAGGGSSAEIGRQTLRLLSSTAFDRDQESEADLAAVRMMAKANIDPEHFANLLFRLSQEKKNLATSFEWLNTHPNSQDRASEILKLRGKETYAVKAVADEKEWAALRTRVEDAERHSLKHQ
jgi:predicted Zn-dependent protease